ncbi:MAG TPA: response regulator [Tepidisphaeraceae bacterium]|nr:response regulator [Tepidisphaeraceae bacterium]
MSDQLHILVIDDDEVDRTAVKRAARASGLADNIAEATDARQALELLRERCFDCILLDHRLPDRDGLSVLRDLRDAGIDAPIIIMTGQGSEQLAVDLMKAGASDYLLKSTVSLEHLGASVRGAVRVWRAEAAQRAAESDLLHRSQQLLGLSRAAVAVNAAGSVEAAMQVITDEARAIIGAHQSMTRVTLEPGAATPAAAGAAAAGAVVGAGAINAASFSDKYAGYRAAGAPAGGDTVASLARGNVPARLTRDELAAHPAFAAAAAGSDQHPPLRGWLSAPMIGRDGRNFGVIQLSDKYDDGEFTPADEAILVQLAQLAAIAIENSRLYDALRRGEEQYRFLAESIPQIVWTAGADGRHEYFNQRWFQYTGLPREQSLDWGWRSALHPDDVDGCLRRWHESVAAGHVYEVEYRFRRGSDGAYRWHLGRALPMRDAGGRIVKWFGTSTDVHDWKQAEEALRVNRERMDLVLDTSELGLWYCDLPFDVLVWNDKVKEHFHLPPDAHVTIELFYERIHPDDREPTRAAIDRSIERRAPYDIVYRTLGPLGQLKWVRAIGRGLYDAAGNPHRFDGITMDVTEQKLAEETLRKAKEAAEAANNAKDQFLAVLSHELRTPLMPVLTTVQTLELEPTLGEDVREGLSVIRRNVELEARLIDDLLDLTRISKGKLQLNFDSVDLHDVIRSAVEICSVDLTTKRLRTTVDLTAAKRAVRGDPARLQQVFWNLIKNAIKFTPAGGHITIHSYDDPAGSVRVAVSDTGIGIEPAALGRIFDAFEQADQWVTRQFGGLGLGLAISKALVDLHGGKLRAASGGVGQGATFTIELRPTTAVAEAAPAGDAPRADVTPPRDVRILLVDDHLDTNRAMARLLQRLGYVVDTADSVQSALDVAGAKKFDLLISDIGLPDGSGLELMRELLERQPIKGIALSGFGMEEDVKKSKAAGFYEHLTKPINFKRLETAIRELTIAGGEKKG